MSCTNLHGDAQDPICQCCQQADQVSPVPMIRLEPEVRFWRCDRCGYVWETQNDEALSA